MIMNGEGPPVPETRVLAVASHVSTGCPLPVVLLGVVTGANWVDRWFLGESTSSFLTFLSLG